MGNRKLLLVGGGGHCRSVLDCVLRSGAYDAIGIVEREGAAGTTVLGIPIVGHDADLPRLLADGWHYVAVTLGSIGAPTRRRALYQQLKALGFQLPVLADPSAVGVLPEPFKTAAIAKSEGKLSAPVSLTDVWDELAGDTGSRLLTGATVVRRAFAEEHPEAVAEFLSCHAASVKAVNAAPADWAQAVVDAGIVDNAKIAEKAIPGCMLVCQTGKDMKAALCGYLQVLADADASAVGGKLPADDFYYME